VRLPSPPVLLITDRAQARIPLPAVAEAVFEAGCRWISVRERDLDPVERVAVTRRLVALASRYRATVTVHGDMVAAGAAQGIHLSQGGDVPEARRRLGSDALIGLSLHDPAQVAAAARDGADYVTLSPIFASVSKPGYGPGPGLEGLRQAASMGCLPIIALGGVVAENAPLCLASGAYGIAVMGVVMAAKDPGRVMRGLIGDDG